MKSPQQLDDQLLDALTHLYDPDYVPPPSLLNFVGGEAADGTLLLQSVLVKAIEDLKPDTPMPADAQLRRIYEVIHCRFVQKLTQDATAERIGLSVRQLNRVQREAVHVLARNLWEAQQTRARHAANAPRTTADVPLDPPAAPDLQATDWQTQAQRELALLEANSSEGATRIRQIIGDVLSLQEMLWPDRNLAVNVGYVKPGLAADVHPSVFRQMLIGALGQLSRFERRGPTTVFAGLEDGRVRITISAALATAAAPSEQDLRESMVVPEGASLEVRTDRGTVYLAIRLPSANPKVTILVVDDNEDMVRFYRRATVGTCYEIVPLGHDELLMERVRREPPDIIIVDVLMPDRDGWQLLMQLHQNPTTREIPVIVSTVIRDEELAISLGAARYIPKPVRPKAFIQALGEVLDLGCRAME